MRSNLLPIGTVVRATKKNRLYLGNPKKNSELIGRIGVIVDTYPQHSVFLYQVQFEKGEDEPKRLDELCLMTSELDIEVVT